MRILAIETAGEACSVALFDNRELLAHEHRVLGRGHAEALVPIIASLPERGRAQRICVSRGPGSFTGVRIGIAAARALGVAWNAHVLGYPTLALIAAMARAQHGAAPVTVAINGGHGEWFVQNFAADGLDEGVALSLTPEAAATRDPHHVIAGNRATQLGGMCGGDRLIVEAQPDARQIMALDATLFAPAFAPIYGRAPDATPQSGKVRP
ncbi:MAG: tRNA (adenosine(37)-N6)-threonylcarbamoyltransferase complex dimerization subunit type 1 TsaB [Erythrobacter sp.]|jgi:tRNA threonylcarbamoyl adenosine modification protein YeaZ